MNTNVLLNFIYLKKLRHDILMSFFRRPKLRLKCWETYKNNGLLGKKNTKGLILKQKGTRMVEDGEDKQVGSDDFEKFSPFYQNTHDDVTPLSIMSTL